MIKFIIMRYHIISYDYLCAILLGSFKCANYPVNNKSKIQKTISGVPEIADIKNTYTIMRSARNLQCYWLTNKSKTLSDTSKHCFKSVSGCTGI